MNVQNKYEQLIREIEKLKDFAAYKLKDPSFSKEYAYGMYSMSYWLYSIAQQATNITHTDNDRFNYVFDIIKHNLQTHNEQLCVRDAENHNGRVYILETLVVTINK